MAAKTIEIGGKSVPMVAFASANHYYRRVFDEDPFVFQTKAANTENGEGLSVTFSMQMGYIMARMAEANGDRGKLSRLSLDDYLDWVDQFESYDLAEATGEIFALYTSQSEHKSQEKKRAD